MDLSKSNLLLDLPTGPVPTPTSTQATVLLLKEMDGEGSSSETEGAADGADGGAAVAGKPVMASLISTGLSDPAETSSTVAASLASTDALPVGFSRLVKRPALRRSASRPRRLAGRTTVAPPAKRASRRAKRSPTRSSRSSAQSVKAIKEAELNRRKKMAEEEASAANLVEEVASGGGSSGADASALEAEDDGSDDGADAAEDEVEAVEFD